MPIYRQQDLFAGSGWAPHRGTLLNIAEAAGDLLPPFTDYPYLRQAFTRGDHWSVQPHRIERLRALSLITDEQAQTFIANGALGSHLEILQRNDGYKGFNQKGISEIIAATDPRRAGHTT